MDVSARQLYPRSAAFSCLANRQKCFLLEHLTQNTVANASVIPIQYVLVCIVFCFSHSSKQAIWLVSGKLQLKKSLFRLVVITGNWCVLKRQLTNSIYFTQKNIEDHHFTRPINQAYLWQRSSLDRGLLLSSAIACLLEFRQNHVFYRNWPHLQIDVVISN